MHRYVTKPIWDKLSRAVTKTSGFTLAQVIFQIEHKVLKTFTRWTLDTLVQLSWLS